MKTTNLTLQSYYPQDLQLTDCLDTPEKITIKLKSCTRACTCPSCGTVSYQCHGTYDRRVQDLPILGKSVELQIHAREYSCINPECLVTTWAESFDGFLNSYSRMTERLADFLCILALETSCEGCARVCNAMGIKISEDSVIRLLLKRMRRSRKRFADRPWVSMILHSKSVTPTEPLSWMKQPIRRLPFWMAATAKR